jgi:uncharacterized 2Fe-2S/4Fe-4S cluster protein (DUF4445 family)
VDIFCKDIAGEKLNLIEILRENGVFFSMPCGGNGTCGKCRVRFLFGAPEANESDKSVLTDKEISEGWRVGCKAVVTGEFAIELPSKEDDIAVETDFGNDRNADELKNGSSNKILSQDTVIAVDIGTTTIAASLVDCENKKTVATVTSVNHQRSFGADVISRIQASNNGAKELLKKTVEDDLRSMASRLGADYENTEMIISGNTTMEHLLLGLSCETLGVSPYTPVDISLHKTGNFTLLPGISTFVGADIVSGIIACGIDESEKICVLIDLGTNGEMAIGNRERILVTSTAAGPAFEGGNISCGVAGIPGAVDSVSIKDGDVSYTTIGNEKPSGICGTGVIEIMYELLENGLVDETGLMDDEYFDDGFKIADGCVFTEKDVREIQLAKAAIRAGLETLIEEYGTDYESIDRIFIAGGFGRKINLKKAAGIGLIPEEFVEKCEAVGNSSLKGAVMFAENPELKQRFCRVSEDSKEISLAESASFNDYYMDQMFFPEV